MRLTSFQFARACARIGASVTVAVLAGCASQSPLTASGDSATAQANSGVQTTKQRRFLGIFSPYRPDIQQGNFVSRETVAQLREGLDKGGMSREQVQFVIGTPLLMDVFHKDRWDYPFRLEKGNGEIITSHVTLFFENNRLSRIEGGDLPTEKDYISLIAGNAPAADDK